MIINKSINQPRRKCVINMFLVGGILIPGLIFCIQLNEPTNSAVPNTAGMTVEKLNVA